MGFQTGASGHWAYWTHQGPAQTAPPGADLQRSSSHPGWLSTALVASAFWFVRTPSSLLPGLLLKKEDAEPSTGSGPGCLQSARNCAAN